jgi:hypothetical protein
MRSSNLDALPSGPDQQRPDMCDGIKTLKGELELIVDNATSHVEQMAPFVALVTADAGFTTCLVPIGNGEFLALKNG